MLIEENKPLAPFTTFGIGGPARWFVEAESEEDIAEAAAWAGDHGVALFVLGGGSNLLVSDNGFEGLILRVGLRGSGIRVVTIAPGFIATPMTAGNPYPMPFLTDVDVFAARAADAIVRGDGFRVIPWQMAWVARLLRVLPNWAFDRALAGRARKPRAGAR